MNSNIYIFSEQEQTDKVSASSLLFLRIPHKQIVTLPEML